MKSIPSRNGEALNPTRCCFNLSKLGVEKVVGGGIVGFIRGNMLRFETQ